MASNSGRTAWLFHHSILRFQDTDKLRSMARAATLIVCVCLVGALASANAVDYRFIGRHNTPGNDIMCGQKDGDGKPQPFCKLCDGLAALADACDNNPECKGFDVEGNYCGYLKGAAGRGKAVYTEGFSHYCKISPGSNCEGAFVIKRRADIPGNDVDCNAKNYKGEKLPYCEVSGNAVEVAAACSANPNCKAFTTTGGSGGYLKTAAGPTTYTEGSTTYVKG